MNDCLICQRVTSAQADQNPTVIHEFESSYLVLGDHQFFEGYSVLILKKHVRELHELSEGEQAQLFKDLMSAAKAVALAFNPWKMNYSCYGNLVEHIHWHLFPRYQSDPLHLKTPWAQSEQFDSKPGSPEERRAAMAKIKQALA